MTLWTIAYQAPLSMGFPRQEYWSELPFPSPGGLPNSGITPASLMSLALQIELLLWPLEKREKAMATHSSTHAWKIPWMEKPGGLQSMGSQRAGHD